VYCSNMWRTVKSACKSVCDADAWGAERWLKVSNCIFVAIMCRVWRMWHVKRQEWIQTWLMST